MRRAARVRLHYTNSEARHGEITQHEEQGTALERREFE